MISTNPFLVKKKTHLDPRGLAQRIVELAQGSSFNYRVGYYFGLQPCTKDQCSDPECQKDHVERIALGTEPGYCKFCTYKTQSHQLKEVVHKRNFMGSQGKRVAYESTALFCKRCGTLWIHTIVPLRGSDQTTIIEHFFLIKTEVMPPRWVRRHRAAA